MDKNRPVKSRARAGQLAALALACFTLPAHAAGLRVDRLEAQGSNAAPFDTIEVQFNQPVLDGTFTSADIVAFTGPGGNVPVASVTKVTSQRYLVSASGTSLQSYTLELGPDIRDAANALLDQDGDGTAGEAIDDVFRGRLIADNANIASGDASFNGRALLFASGAATVDGNHTFAHVEAQRGATPLFQNAATLTFRSLRADSGASLRIGGGTTVNVTEGVVVSGASELRLKAKETFARVGGEWVGAGVTLNAASVNLAAGSSMTADGEGYYQQWRSGAEGGPGYSGHGASHGGRGGGDFGPVATAPYGNAFQPTTLGSGSPTGEHEFSGGGGAIRLNVTGVLVLDGEISADGVVGPDCCGGNTYGSSGGSVWVTVGTLSGSGKFTADGSAAAPAWDVHAGGGGRIAVYYAADSGFAGFHSTTVNGGGHHAEKGSLIFMDTSVANGRTRITQRLSLDPDTEHTFGSVAVENGALLELGGGATLNVTGALTVAGNSTVRVHAKNTFAQVGGVWAGAGATINAGSVTVGAGSIITADGEGYYQQWRSGAEGGPGYNGHGASHGGRGGGDFGPVATAPYGDALQPTTLGSGAPTGEHEFSGGGGAIRLNVAGALVLDGEISADAVVGPDCCGGNTYGSSGGSIWTTAASLSGSGKFTADGAAAAPSWDLHAGGGGRIAVYYSSASNFTGFTNSTVNGGGHHAEEGTLVFIDNSVPGNSIRITQRLEIPADQTLTFGDATVENGALVQLNGGATLDITGALNVSGNSIIRVGSKNRDAQVSGQWVGRGGTIKAGDLTLAAGSIITADGEGYYNMRGPGLGSDPFYMTATHGGKGTNKTHHSDAAYPGDVYAPIELGTGSSNWVNQYTAGGGAIRIEVDGTFTLNGEVSADAVRFGADSQGSAGGSIWVTTDTLRGSGKLTADGGAAELNNAGGGGGRVAVYYTNDGGFTGFISSSVNPGTQPNGLLSEPGTMFFAQQTSEGIDYRVSQRMHVPASTDFGARRLTIDDAALFELGGDAAATVREAVTLAGNSEMRFMSINAARAIGGEFVGRGSRLYAGSLSVDASSKLNADGFGYALNTGPGYNGHGSSHGGRGGNPTQAAPPYGNARAPLDLGSGSAGHIYGPPGGGAIELVIGSAFTLDGAITADAVPDVSQDYNGGSGGSVYVRAGSIAGNGSISADGADGDHSGYVSGAGGRIALLHLGTQTLPVANVAARPGTTRPDLPAEAGSRVIEQIETRFILLSPASGFAHGETAIAYAGLGYDPASTRATVEVRRGTSVFPIGTDRGVVDRLTWDSSDAPDGAASLVVVFRDAAGQVIGEGSAPIVINNAAQWHRGTLTASETWAAGVVHMVEEDVLVPNGITLTIAPGATVKFLPGKRIVAQQGGVVDADGATGQQPILFTAMADDVAAGDTNFDGSATIPRPGDWLGVAVEGTGQFLTSGATETRYARFIRSGNVATQTWPSRTLNIIRNDVTVDGGQTLTIQPGAIVKFEPNRALIVNGTLNAPGTFAQPITLTSFYDDSRGGDSNRDGNTTEPLAGDWRRITINGTANLDHCYIAYGRGEANSNVDGMVFVGGTATLRNCTVANALYDGLFVHGNATLENTLVLRTDRALSAQGGTINATNCVIHDNRVGLFGHGGVLNATNCQITGSSEFGVQQAGSVPALRFSNVFGNGANYTAMADQTGSNGNISVDPGYRAAESDDFHLDFESPAIDAADGSAAPIKDRAGAPRYDDPRTANTGTLTVGGAFADIGAFEFIEAANVASNLDLAVSEVSGPGSALAGGMASVSWTITNVGSEAIVGPWFDTVAMAPSSGVGEVLFAGEFEIGSGVVLGPGQSFRASAIVAVPGAVIGKYQWRVITNTAGTVFEGQNAGNNVAVSLAAFDLDLPELVVDGPPLQSAFAAADQPRWFKVRPARGQQIRLSLDLAGNGITELYTTREEMPTRQLFENKHAQFAAADVTLSIGNTSAQTYYVVAYPAALTAPPQAFTIRAQKLGLSLDSLTLKKIGGTGNVTIGFNGALLSPEGIYELVGPGGTVAAGSITGSDFSRVFATFTLDNLAPGVYTARVTVDGQTVELPNAITVEAVPPASRNDINVRLVAPPRVRASRNASVIIEVTNTSKVDVAAPLLRVTVQGWAPRPREVAPPRLLFMASAPGTGGGSFEIIGYQDVFVLPPPPPEVIRTQFVVLPLNPEHPAGVLPPGFKTQMSLDGIPELASDDIQLFVEDLVPGGNIDFAAFATQQRPGWVAPGAWNIITTNLRTALSDKTTGAATRLAEDATYLAKLGQRRSDVDGLLDWELQKAGHFDEIATRWNVGPMGYGSEPLGLTLTAHSEALPTGATIHIVDITSGLRSRRRFRQTVSGGAFTGDNGDAAILSDLGGGTYTLRETNGMVTRFERLSAEAEVSVVTALLEPHREPVTFGYTDGRLMSQTSATGRFSSFAYNAAGRITTITSPYGRTLTFGYDAANEHLVSITDSEGRVTTYSYYLGEGAAKEHAVKRISMPDGQTIDLDYDSHGRIARMTQNGSASSTTLMTYDIQGQMTVTSPTGQVSKVAYDPAGRTVREQVMGTEATFYTYDAFGLLRLVQHDSQAAPAVIGYDSGRNPLVMRDAAGNKVAQTLLAGQDVATSITDPRGYTTRFGYDQSGPVPLLSEIIHADGAAESFSYDGARRLTAATNARRQNIDYEHDSKGKITRHVSSGTDVEWQYDPTTQLPTVVTRRVGVATATTTITYTARREIDRVTYPDGRYIDFDYDAQGRRTQITTSEGYVAKYDYDLFGRLSTVRDASSAIICIYDYDASGRVKRKALGSQVKADYSYNQVGKIEELHFSRSSGAIEQFAYTYDRFGRYATQANSAGTTVYNYDVLGQLDEVQLPGGRVIEYHYDASGNRIAIVDNGATTAAVANQVNQIVQFGQALLTYDADGNLTTRGMAGAATTYSFDAESKMTAQELNGENWQYEYDVFGNLAAVTRGGQRTEFVVDPITSQVISEVTNGVATHYFHGYDLLARDDAGAGRAFYLPDAHGHIAALVDTGGDTLNRYSYLPFGETTVVQEQRANRLRYAGSKSVLDHGNGLLHTQAREYDPALGRFISRDPRYLPGGNLYHYCGNQPVGEVDFTGLDGQSASPSGYAYANSVFKGIGTSFATAGFVGNWLAQGARDHAATALSAWARNPTNASAFQAFQTSSGYAQSAGKFAKGFGMAGQAIGIGRAWADVAHSMVGPNGLYARCRAGDVGAGLELYKNFGKATTKTALTFTPVAIVAEPLVEGIDYVSYDLALRYQNWNQRRGIRDSDVFGPDALWHLKNGIRVPILRSRDPNDITGPAGFGPEMWIDDSGVMHFTIRFENQPSATAAAYRVQVSLPLDSNFDASTFQFDQIGLPGTILTALPGQQFLTTRADVSTDPNPVKVIARLDAQTRTVTWEMESFDANTGELPEDPLAGFLPPNNDNGDGEGFVSFTIRPLAGTSTSSATAAKASIVFDTNEPIETNIWQNLIDNTPPASAVQPLNPTQTTASFNVTWSGTDAGSGIVDYTLYVSENGGPYNVWLADTTLTSATFTGQPNATYAFYSIAEDGVGFRETAPGSADAMTAVQLPVSPSPSPSPTPSATPSPSASPSPSPTAKPRQLLNIATRLRVQTGENVLIGGLIVTGTAPKRVIIRAIGPSLSQVVDGALGDPVLELYQGDSLLGSNDNWRDTQPGEIEETTIPPQHDLESAIVRTLLPGFYTAVMGGKDGATGIGVIEVYDLDQTADAKLANISSRGFVESGENVMIGGLIVGGNGSVDARVLVRAIGPSLVPAGVADALRDPTLQLVDAEGNVVRENDNWKDQQHADIEATTIPPSDDAEAAILATLAPGNYTAVVRGQNGGTGVGLVEVYNVP